jgi:hypothetical protein
MDIIDRLYQFDIIKENSGKNETFCPNSDILPDVETHDKILPGAAKILQKNPPCDIPPRGKRSAAPSGVTRMQAAYVDIRAANPDKPKVFAARAAGYSAPPYNIEASAGFKSMASRLEAAAETVGITPEHNLRVLKDVSQDVLNPAARVSAVKVANDMLGYAAPQQIQVQHTAAIGVFLQRLRDADVDVRNELSQVEADTGTRASIRD